MKKELTPTTTKGELLQDEFNEVIWTPNWVRETPSNIFEVYSNGKRIGLFASDSTKEYDNITEIVAAVNERQKLLDSNRELLDALKELVNNFSQESITTFKEKYKSIESAKQILNKINNR